MDLGVKSGANLKEKDNNIMHIVGFDYKVEIVLVNSVHHSVQERHEFWRRDMESLIETELEIRRDTVDSITKTISIDYTY
jgi:hypothetical protein